MVSDCSRQSLRCQAVPRTRAGRQRNGGHGSDLHEAIRDYRERRRARAHAPRAHFRVCCAVYGNALAVLGTWINDETLWRIQRRWLETADHQERCEFLANALGRAMQTRPVPPLLHRTVAIPWRLGELDLHAGERVVLGISGATEDNLSRNTSDVMMVFGGDRYKASILRMRARRRIAKGVLPGIARRGPRDRRAHAETRACNRRRRAGTLPLAQRKRPTRREGRGTSQAMTAGNGARARPYPSTRNSVLARPSNR